MCNKRIWPEYTKHYVKRIPLHPSVCVKEKDCQTGYGQIRNLMKRLNIVLSNKLQDSKPSRFYSVRNAEKLQQEQKKGRLTNPSHRPKQQRFLQKKERMTTYKSLHGILHRNKRKTTEKVPKHL